MWNWLKGKKTVIFNIAAAATMYGEFLPPKYSVPVVTGGNIVLRVITDGPETVIRGIISALAAPSK